MLILDGTQDIPALNFNRKLLNYEPLIALDSTDRTTRVY